MKLKLTKKSKNELMNWHGGSGTVFFSTGEGNSFKIADFFFRKYGEKYRLGIGNKSILLTDEQIKEMGEMAIEDNL